MGDVPWSPELQLTMRRIAYLQRCRMKYAENRKVKSRTLSKLFRQAKMETPIINAQQAITGLKNAFKEYNEIKRHATQKRHHFLESLAEALSLETNLKKESILKQLMEQESKRMTFRKIKYSLGRFRSGVSALEIITELGWEITTDKEQIEAECIKENKKRFTQAKNTPPMQTSQIELIGWTANTKAANNILDGIEMEDSRFDPCIKRMLPYYKRCDEIVNRGAIGSSISLEEYLSG
jgi:hypothetical protein